MKRKSLYTSWAMLLLGLTLSLLSIQAFGADGKEPASATDSQALPKASQAMKAKDYNLAAQLYEQALRAESARMAQEEVSPEKLSDAYYNLGNCYFRMKDYSHAVLNFQRALRMNPANADAAFNLELTQSKLQDRFDSPAEMFFISWTRKLVSARSAEAWAATALMLLVLSLALTLVYLFAHRVVWRKVGFFAAAFGFLITLATATFACMQRSAYLHNKQLIVMQEVQAYSGPSATAKKARTLHEGTTLKLLDRGSNGWQLIEMPDGQQGWISGNHTEAVSIK